MDKHQRCVAEGCQAKEAKGYQDCEQHSGCCAILPTEKHPDRLILDLRQAAEMIGFATSMVERQAHRQAADEAAAKLQERFRSSAAPEEDLALKMSRELAKKVYSMAIRPQDTWTAFEQAMVHSFALLHASRVITKAEAFGDKPAPQHSSEPKP